MKFTFEDRMDGIEFSADRYGDRGVHIQLQARRSISMQSALAINRARSR